MRREEVRLSINSLLKGTNLRSWRGGKESSMQRALLAARYRSLFEQHKSRENTAEWRVYRDAVDVLGSRTSLPQIVQQLKQACDDCCFYANRDGAVEDPEYGTYGNYMMTKKTLYEEVIRDVLVCHYEQVAWQPNFKEDLPTLLSWSFLIILQQPSLTQVKTDLRTVIHTLLSRVERDPRRRKVQRKAATIYAQVLLALGGTLS
jgi:hypothetical protein